MLVTAAMSVAEGAFAGRLGVGALAGLALVFPLVMLTQMLAAGAIGGAISSAVARALGAGDPARAGRLTAGRAYFRTVAPAYPFFALGLALYFASQGAGRMLWPVAASVLRMAVAIGAALALVEAGLGLQGVYLGIASGMVAYGALTAVAVRLTRWH